MKAALQRPDYLVKLPDVKVWTVFVETGYEVSTNKFTNLQQAKRFAARNKIKFDEKDFDWVPQSKLATLQGLQHGTIK